MSLRRLKEERLPLLVIAAVWAVTTACWLTPGITKPDGAGYFVYLPSTWIDHDLLFFDEWKDFGLIRNGVILHKEVTATDHLGDHWTVGSALVWFPAYVLGDAMRLVIPSLKRFPRNGLSLPYNVPVIASSALAGLLALLAGFSICRRQYGQFPSAMAAIGVWLGTPLLWYSLRNPIMSHVMSAAACTTVVWLSMRISAAASSRSLFACGIAAGVAFAIRPQDGTFLLVPLFFLSRVELARSMKPFLALGSGFLLGSLPELVVSSFIYGTPVGFLTGGGAARPFAAFERIWWWEPIFSWYHGLIPWSPFIVLSITGFYFLWRDDRRLAVAALYSFLAQWAVNATLERSFWGAYAFGQRRFLDCAVFFLVAAAALFSRLPRFVSVLLLALTSLWSLSIFFAASSRLDLSIYYTPSELWQQQLHALKSAGHYFRFFDSVPRPMTGFVVMLVVATVILWGALTAALLSRPARRWGTEIAAAALVTVSCLLVVCGIIGRNRTDAYSELIGFNRLLSSATGGADLRVGLLSDELMYLKKSGRMSEARATELELNAVIAKRDGGLLRLRSRPVMP